MDLYDEVVEATAEEFQQHIAGNALIKALATGQVKRGHYLAYLQQTYHLVRHTSRALALAGARLEDDRRELRNWFFHQVEEENGHDLFCIKDVSRLDEPVDEIFAGQPRSGAWGLITQNYFMATYGNPVGILGVATATEGLGATMASQLADVLIQRYGIPSNAVTFLRSHGGFDVRHLEEAKQAVNQLVHPDEVELVIHARRMTFINYGRLFQEALEYPIEPRGESLSSAA